VIEFFFDVSSPWTWLGFESIQPLAADLGVPIEWRPILVGGVFNAVNGSVYESRKNPVPAKARYMLKDLADWARLQGLTIKFPPSVFPVNSVKAMRACCWLGRRRSEGAAPRQHRRTDRAGRLRLADDLRGRRRHVFRQRPHAADR
jgi:2-hydroxychromene-2-carboxylate isomerase